MKEILDNFLEEIHELEGKIVHLIHRSNLTVEEKQFILDHILIIPGKKEDHDECKAIS